MILESDILFNANPNLGFQWMTNGQYSPSCWQTANSYGLMLDTQGIATHELGHSLGIDHPATQDTSPTAPTMANACTTDARSLATDDINALACSENRYPQDPSYEGSFLIGTCRSISGRALNTNRPGRSSYVEIVESMSNGTTRIINVRATNPLNNETFSFVPGSTDGLKDGKWHSIRVRHTGTAEELPGSPKNIICGVKLFPETMAPNDPPLSTNGLPYEVGTQFESSVAGYITRIGYYFAAGEGDAGPHTVNLWSDTGTPLGSASINPPPF